MIKFIVLVSLSLLVACSSHTTSQHYYRLNYQPLAQHTSVIEKSNDDIIWIAPVVLSGWLDQQGIIYQTKPFEYVIAKNHHWAAPLAAQLRTILTNNLSALLPHNLISSSVVDSPKMIVNVFIDGFHGTYEGDVIIKGYWLITYRDGRIIRKNFEHRIAQYKEGYETLVETLSIGWQNEISQLIKSVKF